MSRPFLTSPADWTRGTLEPVPDGLISKVTSGGTPSTSIEENWDGDVLWLTPKELSRGRPGFYVTETERKITEKGLRSSGAKILPIGTVLLTKRAPVGLVGIAGAPLTTNQGFLNFICGEQLLPTYLAYWFIANRPYLDAVAIGSTYPELYKSDLFEFEIAVPSVAEQRKIVEVMRTFDFVVQIGSSLEQVADADHIPGVQRQTKRLEELRVNLLRGLLSGRISASEFPGLSLGEHERAVKSRVVSERRVQAEEGSSREPQPLSH